MVCSCSEPHKYKIYYACNVSVYVIMLLVFDSKSVLYVCLSIFVNDT